MESVLRLRGIMLNPENLCPACGAETDRGNMPSLLRPLQVALGSRVTYRWCGRCLRNWVAFHRRVREPARMTWPGLASGPEMPSALPDGLESVRIAPPAPPTVPQVKAVLAPPRLGRGTLEEVEASGRHPDPAALGHSATAALEAPVPPPEVHPAAPRAACDPGTAALMRERIEGMIDRLEAGEVSALRSELREERWLEEVSWHGVPRPLQAETRASFVEVLVALTQDPPDGELAQWHLWMARARFDEGELSG